MHSGPLSHIIKTNIALFSNKLRKYNRHINGNWKFLNQISRIDMYCNYTISA